MILKLCFIILLIRITYGYQKDDSSHGYIDKLVSQYKKDLLSDLGRMPLLDVEDIISIERCRILSRFSKYCKPPVSYVTLKPAPKNFEDDPSWDINSALRLLALLRWSPKTPTTLRRMAGELLEDTRRLKRHRESYSPNIYRLSKKEFNNMYHDDGDNLMSDEQLEPKPSHDSQIIYISNPVEARLPSGKISVDLLKRIMEARAKAARILPTTQRTTMHVDVDNNTEIDEVDGKGKDATTDKGADAGGAATKDGEAATGATGDTTGAGGGGGETTAAAPS